MRIAIVACDTFKRELEELTHDDDDFVYHEYLEFGLHEFPKELKVAVIEKVNSLEGKVDAVLLGYGTCQSLKDIEKELKVPTVTFHEDDCIGVFLTQDEYNLERKKCAGTFYAIPYFAEMGMDFFTKNWEKRMGDAAKEIDINQIVRFMFDGYSRSLYVHTTGDREHYECCAKKFADDLSLRHESRDGTLKVMKDAIEQVKELASIQQAV
ncbi:MAG: hypothetical protein A4E32_01025 [Methanomassiliicoccales archaeon PtaU1.Bin124]|nr:MAG: hypothetical protein A4E32_01025 [Methanomassiliicoccales archaeon PtaU1.Bin124]